MIIDDIGLSIEKYRDRLLSSKYDFFNQVGGGGGGAAQLSVA